MGAGKYFASFSPCSLSGLFLTVFDSPYAQYKRSLATFSAIFCSLSIFQLSSSSCVRQSFSHAARRRHAPSCFPLLPDYLVPMRCFFLLLPRSFVLFFFLSFAVSLLSLFAFIIVCSGIHLVQYSDTDPASISRYFFSPPFGLGSRRFVGRNFRKQVGRNG